jgi:hypothetical protein
VSIAEESEVFGFTVRFFVGFLCILLLLFLLCLAAEFKLLTLLGSEINVLFLDDKKEEDGGEEESKDDGVGVEVEADAVFEETDIGFVVEDGGLELTTRRGSEDDPDGRGPVVDACKGWRLCRGGDDDEDGGEVDVTGIVESQYFNSPHDLTFTRLGYSTD